MAVAQGPMENISMYLGILLSQKCPQLVVQGVLRTQWQNELLAKAAAPLCLSRQYQQGHPQLASLCHHQCPKVLLKHLPHLGNFRDKKPDMRYR